MFDKRINISVISILNAGIKKNLQRVLCLMVFSVTIPNI